MSGGREGHNLHTERSTHPSKDMLREIGLTTENSSKSGIPPYIRGIHKNMYLDRLWTMRQYAGFSDAKSTNTRFLDLLDNGQSGLSVAFDLPTQLGLNSN